MKLIISFGRFWWDFIVGDEWRIAAGVVASLTVGAVLVAETDVPDTLVSVLVALAIISVVAVSITGPAREARSNRKT